MFCTECGSKLPDNVRFCPVCGTKLQQANDGGGIQESASQSETPVQSDDSTQPKPAMQPETPKQPTLADTEGKPISFLSQEVESSSQLGASAAPQPASSMTTKVLMAFIGILSAAAVVLAGVVVYYYLISPAGKSLSGAEQTAGVITQQSKTESKASTTTEPEATKKHDPDLAPQAMYNDTLQAWHDAQKTNYNGADKSNLVDLAAYARAIKKDGQSKLMLFDVDVRKVELSYAYILFPDNTLPGMVISAVDSSGNYAVLAVYRISSSTIGSNTHGEIFTKSAWKITPDFRLLSYRYADKEPMLMVYDINHGPVEAATCNEDGTYSYTSWTKNTPEFEENPQRAWDTLLKEEQPKVKWNKLSDFEPVG